MTKIFQQSQLTIRSTMLRFITISCMVLSAVAQFGNNELDNTFSPSENSISNSKCNKIEGNLKGCYECYKCDEDKIREKRNQGKQIFNLVLNDGDCKSLKVCCISQRQLTFRDADNTCGASNPNGYPYSVRPRARTVLHGEYPWRAWVYRKSDSSRPLCAATYIDENSSVLLVPGKCVRNLRPDSIFVRFLKHTQENFVVKNIIVHKDFNSETHQYDIALLSLESPNTIPSWAKAACLPEVVLLSGSTCVGVSDNDNSIGFMIPDQSECAQRDQLATSLMCAMAPPRDYKHEYGGGLFCLNNNLKKPTYTVYGIALHASGDVMSVYTDITALNITDWVKQQIRRLLII